MANNHACSIGMHDCVLHFSSGVNTLAQLASQQLYAGKHMLSFSMIEPSNSILVSGVTNQTDYCLKLYFQRISGMNTVTNVEHLSSTHVRITFNSCQCK